MRLKALVRRFSRRGQTHWSAPTIALIIFGLFMILAACSQAGDPGVTMQKYLEARAAANADTIRSLSCAAWEGQAVMQADLFADERQTARRVVPAKRHRRQLHVGHLHRGDCHDVQRRELLVAVEHLPHDAGGWSVEDVRRSEVSKRSAECRVLSAELKASTTRFRRDALQRVRLNPSRLCVFASLRCAFISSFLLNSPFSSATQSL